MKNGDAARMMTTYSILSATMERIKTILLATDLSENSRSRLLVSSHLAMQMQTRLIILHVVEGIQELYEGIAAAILGVDRWRETDDRLRQKADTCELESDRTAEIVKVVFSEFCRDIARKDKEFKLIERDIVVSKGKIVDAINDEAEKHNQVMIVMGTGGDYLSGKSNNSYATSVLRKTRRPVMVIPTQNRS